MSEHAISGRHLHIHTRDLDEAREGMRSLYGDVHVDAGAAFEWRAKIADLGPVVLVQGECDTNIRLAADPKAHVLSLPVRNAARIQAPGGSVEAARGLCAALLSPGARVVWGTETDIQVITARVDPLFLGAHLEALAGEAAHAPISFAPALRTDSGPGASIERLCHFLADEINRGTPLDHPVLLTGLRDTLARALLTGHVHSHAHLLKKPAPSSGLALVRRVEEYVDAHAAEPLCATDLAALGGAGALSIEAAFREHRRTTLAELLRGRRLEHARRRILAEPHLPVVRLVHASGFLRPEAFEVAYFKAFRERPEDTRRRALAGAVPPRRPGAEEDARAGQLASLSGREREVCAAVAQGRLNKQIAMDLSISERTVREHRARGMKKLGVESAAELGRLLAQLLPP